MNTLKANKLHLAGLTALGVFVLAAYYHNAVYLNKILICSIIFGEILLMKIIGSFQRNSQSQVTQSEKEHSK